MIGGVRRRGAQQQQRELWRGAQPAAVRGSEVRGEAGRAERRQRVEWRWEEQRGGARLAEEQPDREEAEAHGHQPQARRAQHAEPQHGRDGEAEHDGRGVAERERLEPARDSEARRG